MPENFEYNKGYELRSYDETRFGTYKGKLVLRQPNNFEPKNIGSIFKVQDYFAYPPNAGSSDRSAYVLVFENMQIFGASRTIDGLISLPRYVGCDHATIKVGERDIPREEFILECSEAGVKTEDVKRSLEEGMFCQSYTSKGEIKVCPSCNKIRQTSCCACGCGSCEVCGHRWNCGSPVNFGPVVSPLGFGDE